MFILFATAAALWPWSRKRFSKTKTPAQKFITNLPDDVLIEILIRVPDSRSAIRCGAVCKRWNNLTAKNPQFIPTVIRHRQHRGGGGGSPHLCFFLQKGSLPRNIGYRTFLLSSEKPNHLPIIKKLPIGFFDFVRAGTGRIRASCDDLLLVSKSYTTDYFICNMITGWRVRLPPAPRLPSFPRFYGLVCKYTGTDVLFRVVLFDNNPSHIRVSVFSSETQNWTTSAIDYQTDLVGGQPERHNDSVVARGGILYLNCPYSCRSILALDPFAEASEKQTSFRFVSLPKKMSNNMMIPFNYLVELSLGVCRGRVRASKLYFGRDFNQWPHNNWLMLETWELKEDESSWSFLHRAEFSIGSVHDIRRAKFHPNDPDVVFLKNIKSVYRCNFREKKLAKVADVPILYPFDLTSCRELTMFSLVEPCLPTPAPTLPGLIGRRQFRRFQQTIIYYLKLVFEELFFC